MPHDLLDLVRDGDEGHDPGVGPPHTLRVSGSTPMFISVVPPTGVCKGCSEALADAALKRVGKAITEGVVNYFLMVRIGRATKRQLQPVIEGARRYEGSLSCDGPRPLVARRAMEESDSWVTSCETGDNPVETDTPG